MSLLGLSGSSSALELSEGALSCCDSKRLTSSYSKRVSCAGVGNLKFAARSYALAFLLFFLACLLACLSISC